MAKCKVCRDGYDDEDVKDGTCRWCEQKGRFASFAQKMGLKMFPDPTGERYVYNVDLSCAGKKSECDEMIDLLWNALAKSQGMDDVLI